MEMLFNIDISQVDLSQLKIDLVESDLSSFAEEQLLVDGLYSIQEELSSLIDIAETFSEDVYAHSSDNISTRMANIESSGVPTVNATIVDLIGNGFNASSGLMTSSLLDSSYSQFYWKMGDYVEIINTSIVPRTLLSTLDSIMTRSTLESFFLRDIPGEVLSRCTTSFVSGSDIRNQDIDDEKAITYGDLKRFFILKQEYINVAIKTVRTPFFILEENTLKCENVIFPSKTILSKLVSSNGTVQLRFFIGNFMQVGGFITDNAFLAINSDTNTIVKISAIEDLQENYAPKINWVTSDLSKSDVKPQEFIDNMIIGILENEEPLAAGFDSVVAKSELDYSIEKLMETISDFGVCDDD